MSHYGAVRQAARALNNGAYSDYKSHGDNLAGKVTSDYSRRTTPSWKDNKTSFSASYLTPSYEKNKYETSKKESDYRDYKSSRSTWTSSSSSAFQPSSQRDSHRDHPIQENYERSRKEVEEKDNEISSLKKQVKDLEKQNEILSNQVKEKDNEISSLKKQVKESEKQNDILSNQVSDLESSLKKSEITLRTRIEEKVKKKICVMCINEATLLPIANALYHMKSQPQFPRDVEICENKLQGSFSVDEKNFQNAYMIVLVAFPEPRTLLLSDTEPSQLGPIYKEAARLQKEVFMIYADTKFSDSLKNAQTYHKSLKNLFENQLKIGELKDQNRFISVKVKEKDNVQKLNEAQRKAILNWITKCTGS